MDNRRSSSTYPYNSSNPHSWIVPVPATLPLQSIHRTSETYDHNNHAPRVHPSQAHHHHQQHLHPSMSHHDNYNNAYAYERHKSTSSSTPSYYPGAPTHIPTTSDRQIYTPYTSPTYPAPSSHHVHSPSYIPQLPQYMSHVRQPEETQYPASPPRPFSCDMCPLSFNRQHDLKRHRETHSGDKPFLCNECGKSFTRKDALKRHQTVKKCGNFKAG